MEGHGIVGSDKSKLERGEKLAKRGLAPMRRYAYESGHYANYNDPSFEHFKAQSGGISGNLELHPHATE